jgi:hypothetical protein
MVLRRKRYLVEPSLQLKVIGILGLVALAAAINVGVLVFYHQEKQQLIVANSGLAPAVIAQQMQTMTHSLMLQLIGTLGIMIAGFLFVGSWITHRIAGPLYKLRYILRDHLDGKKVPEISFREKDEFRDVLEMIRTILDNAKK